MKFLFLLLFIACGKEAYVGSRDNEDLPQTSQQVAQCNPPRNPNIVYMGVPCRLQCPVGQNYQYQCANNRIILVDCNGSVL